MGVEFCLRKGCDRHATAWLHPFGIAGHVPVCDEHAAEAEADDMGSISRAEGAEWPQGRGGRADAD